MNSFFSEAQRADDNTLLSQIDIITENPVMTGLLHSISGLLAIMNEHRQIIALNDSIMEMLGIDNPSEMLGLRLGEVVKCVHAEEEPAECGTTRYCSTCGAAIAIASSLTQDRSIERICALSAKKFNEIADLVFLVRSTPVKIDSIRVLLIILQDITIQQQRAALERTFFHDIRNMLCGVIGVSELLSIDDVNPEHIKIVQQSSKRMLKEIELQQCLIQNERFSYQSELVEITPGKIINELASYFINHPVAMGKFVNFSHSELNVLLRIDVSILLRILCNMVTNALEATDDNGIIKVWFEQEQGSISFYVWNNNSIDESTSLRIFQRNFSTKSGEGRGIGTYSMKLFGEKMLGGKVSFTTSPADGTTFKIALSC